MIVGLILALTRILVAAAAAWTAVVALVHWAVRRGHLAPFGPLPRAIRAASDPLLRPIERRLLRSGGNPQQAPLWLFLGVLVGGLLLLSLLEWFFVALFRVGWAVQAGPRAVTALLVNVAFTVVIFALVIRVIGTWFGLDRTHRWVGITWRLTDWIVRPLQRWLPATGPLDLSPLVAWLVLLLLRGAVLGLLR